MNRYWISALGVILLVAAASVAAAQQWSRKYVSSLPDSAFAAVETAPNGRKLRHLPHHDHTGALDIPHLKSARARLKQVKWADPANAEKARLHLEEHWREYQQAAAQTRKRPAPLDLNRASLEELMRLPRIGEKTARAILNYREAHGSFKSVNELQLVHGIGPKTFEAIKDLVTVK